jgi:hypothetical protein
MPGFKKESVFPTLPGRWLTIDYGSGVGKNVLCARTLGPLENECKLACEAVL